MAGEERGDVVISGLDTDNATKYHPFRINAELYLATISENHLQIHLESAFKICHDIPTIANLAKFYILFRTPEFKAVHLRIWELVAASGPTFFRLREGAEIPDNGTEITPYSMKRETTNTPGMKIYHSPTISDLGLELPECSAILGDKKTGGSEGNKTLAWVLLRDTNYLWEIENKSGAILADTLFSMFWFETEHHPPIHT